MNEFRKLNWSFKSRKCRSYGQKSKAKKEKIFFVEEHTFSPSLVLVDSTSYLACNKIKMQRNTSLKDKNLLIILKNNTSKITMLIRFFVHYMSVKS
jgi:hypothetical protein